MSDMKIGASNIETPQLEDAQVTGSVSGADGVKDISGELEAAQQQKVQSARDGIGALGKLTEMGLSIAGLDEAAEVAGSVTDIAQSGVALAGSNNGNMTLAATSDLMQGIGSLSEKDDGDKKPKKETDNS